MDKLKQQEVPSALTLSEGKAIAWFCIMDGFEVKKTKNNKNFIKAKVSDNEGNMANLKIWGDMDTSDLAYTIWMAEVNMQADWGLSTNSFKMKRVTAFD
jgi:hypothetical protein